MPQNLPTCFRMQKGLGVNHRCLMLSLSFFLSCFASLLWSPRHSRWKYECGAEWGSLNWFIGYAISTGTNLVKKKDRPPGDTNDEPNWPNWIWNRSISGISWNCACSMFVIPVVDERRKRARDLGLHLLYTARVNNLVELTACTSFEVNYSMFGGIFPNNKIWETHFESICNSIIRV